MNEVWNVLTYRDYNFDDNGRQVKGRTLHCYRSNDQSGWPGVEYAKFSVPFGSEAYNVSLTPGSKFEFVFNRFGKVAALIPVK